MTGRARLELWLGAACVAVFAALLTFAPVWSRDWGWHLATVERILAEGALPWQDVFSYTAGHRYEPVHLIYQFGLEGFVALLGVDVGLGLYRMALTVAFAVAAFLALGRRGVGAWTAVALTGLLLSAGAYRFMVRPHMFTTLGLVVLLDTLVAARAGRLRHPVRLVPLFLLWANAHPGVVYGVLTAVGFVLCEGLWTALGRRGALTWNALRRLAGWVLAAVLCTFVHPLGPGLYPYLFGHRGMQDVLAVSELAPLFTIPFSTNHLVPTVLIVGALALVVRFRRRVDPTLTLAGLAFCVLGCIAARELPLTLIVLAFALARPLAAATRRLAPGTRQLLFALALLPVLSGVVRHTELRLGVNPRTTPVLAADWILEHEPQGRLYNTNAVGGYLVYRLAPRTADGAGWQVYSDGRMPMFYEALSLAKDFAAVEARYAPEILVVDWQTPDASLVHSCEQVEGFHARYALVHVSSGAKVYLRRKGPNDALIAAEGYQHLTYLGVYWPGRAHGAGAFRPLPEPADPQAFRAEVERARRGDPGLRHLPPF